MVLTRPNGISNEKPLTHLFIESSIPVTSIGTLCENTLQNKNDNSFKNLGHCPNPILNVLTDQEYMSAVREKVNLISEFG